MSEPIIFEASFPAIQSAIKVDGAGGARVQLDIPETELPAIARLLLMRGKVLKVSVEEKSYGRKAADKARAPRRGPGRSPSG